ncbi:MAG: tol-pal system protein YbgF [Lautropia sp.]|nr:tol-pal system protein YbgF [Lautropia sp.]
MTLQIAHPSLKAALLAAGLLLASPPAHALFGDNEARQAVLDLRAKVDTLQRDMLRQLNELSNRQNEIEQRLGRLESAQKAGLARQNEIDQLRQEVAQLRGQLEETLNELQNQQRTQQDLSADVDSRLKRFEPVEVTIDGKQFTVEQAEKRQFDAALSRFRKSEFKAAVQAFQEFIKAYPESPYLPTAMYWQGGAQYAQSSYKTAISTLQSMIQRYPDSGRVPDALLLIGNAQADSGNPKNARATFQRIGKEYPGTPAANSARERLKNM